MSDVTSEVVFGPFWLQSIKVSKDSDCRLVSKNFSEILPSNGLSPGPGEVGQGGLKVLY